MKLTPSSTARRRTVFASSRSAGGPQIPSPVIRIAPNPRRRTSSSRPRVRVPAADASVVVKAMRCPYPGVGPSIGGARPCSGPGSAVGVEGEGELDVGAGDGDERAGLRRAAVKGGQLHLDQGDEVEVAAV